MPSLEPRPRIAPEPTVRPRAARRQAPRWVEAVALSEGGFRQWVREFERSPLFRALADEGYLRRSRWRGWIPAEEYAAYLDAEMLPVIERHRLEDRPGWLAEFATASPGKLEELARTLRIPLPEARRLRRYAQRILEEDVAPLRGERPGARTAPVDPTTPRPASVGGLQEFVARYALDPDDLRTRVIDTSIPLAQAAAELGVPEDALEDARRAATAILVLADEPPEETAPRDEPAGEEPPLARLLVEGGIPRWAFDESDEYALTYRLRAGFGERLAALASSEEEARAFFERIHRMNQRKSLVCAMLSELLRAQWRYLATGEERYRAPLAQAELARRIGEHRSTVCRLLRGRWVASPWGPLPLARLVPSRAEVVAPLLAELAGASDRQVSEELARRFGLRLSRRTIAYHRARLAPRG